MTKVTSEELITQLQEKIHEVLAPLVPTSQRFVLLDYPDHANVGDSAIWLGEINYFRNFHKATPAYVCHYQNIDWEQLEHKVGNGTIFLHGGGNFGDIWPQHQQFREEVLTRFPNHAVVQLPQSLHFSNAESLRKAAAIINAHRNFTLLVRDNQSYAIAKENFSCNVQLCPDMAFCIGSLPKPVKPTYSLLLLMRTDHEKSALNQTSIHLPEGTLVADWLEDEAGMHARVRKQTILRLLPDLGFRALNKHYQREKLYRGFAEARLKRGLTLLSSAEYLITDRLHAHILSILINLPHTTLDNNYRKLDNFSDLWTHNLDILSTADSLSACPQLK